MNGIIIKETVTTTRVKTVEIPVDCIEEMLRRRFGMHGHKVEVEFDAGRGFLVGAIVTLTDTTFEETPAPD